MWEKVKLLKMSNFTFFYNVFFAIFYLKIPFAIFTLKSCNSHISVVICSFFEFRMVSKWCIREWFKSPFYRAWSILTHHALDTVTDEQTSKNIQKPNLEHLNTFPYEPVVLCVCSINLLKTLWEKEKLFQRSNFSFAHTVFTNFLENFPQIHQIDNCPVQFLSVSNLR